MSGRLRHFRRTRLDSGQGETYANQVLLTPVSERLERALDLHLDDPETLLALLGALPKQWDAAPARVLEEATFLYDYLRNLEVRRPIDPILYDEREYFLGESARIAGTACRFLSRRDQSRRWFDLAEAWFLATENSASNIARVTYQRLALRLEEREFDAVLELVPHLIHNFERMSMLDDSLKARLLHAVVLKETAKTSEACVAFEEIVRGAKEIRNDLLLASACVNLSQIKGFLGQSEEAAAWAREATPILLSLGNRIGLAQLQWGLGYLLRSRGNFEDAVAAYRVAQREFREIEMHADVAAVHLVLADLLLDAGQPARAEWEIRAALPIIEEYKLVPEGIAAFSLLRDSLRRRQIDRQALRNLHGYFREQ